MASVSDIATVRRNVNEPTDTIYSDSDIGVIVDADGVAGASATIWREKAAVYSGLVNVSESGASHSYSDLSRNALAMASAWDKQVPVVAVDSAADRVHVKRIVRS